MTPRWGGLLRRRGAVAATFAVLFSWGCSLSIDKVGVGDQCRRPKDCLSGLVCVNRVCEAPTLQGTPTHYVPPDAGTEPADAGTDAGASDAGTDASANDASVDGG